jgi:hypothetical protein
MDGTNGASRPRGDITTLIDLTTRDSQDDYFTPLASETTWFTRDQERRNRPFVPAVQNFAYRGPAAFGQRFSFDIGSVACGDILFGIFLQIKLGHWFDPTTVLRIQSGRYVYKNPNDAWYYANSLGSVILAKAELEVEDQIIETVDGDFGFTMGRLMADLNSQVGYNIDGTGFVNFRRLQTWPQHRVFPVENGIIQGVLPLFFSRSSFKEAFPLIACREGTVRIHITLRPFTDCVRIQSGLRTDCLDSPLGKTFEFIDTSLPYRPTVTITASRDPPAFQNLQLITYGAYLNGNIRQQMLRSPFEIMHRAVQTWEFTEPLKYLVNKIQGDSITVQLPLEANHPMEEIVWFLRRKAAITKNNERTDYTNIISAEYNQTYNPPAPFLVSAELQINGIQIVAAEEEYFRQLIARHHKGGIAAYASFIYGYPFARHPGQHQPSGTLNASRTQDIRLTLTVTPPGGQYDQEWEVVVYVLGIRWLRFENGIANKMFQD